MSGGNKHIFYITDLTNVLKYDVFNALFGGLSQVLGKLSVGALIIRLMTRGAFKIHKIMIYTCMVTYIILTILLISIEFAQCKPAAALWDKTIMPASCWNPSVYTDCAVAHSCKRQSDVRSY